jgi:hypothetical protein
MGLVQLDFRQSNLPKKCAGRRILSTFGLTSFAVSIEASAKEQRLTASTGETGRH